MLYWASPVYADPLPYAGITMGSAKSSASEQFDPAYSAYLFMGIQTDYYMTYELGLSYFQFDTFEGEARGKPANLVNATALGHLPIGDSSLFARLGISGYQYFDDQDRKQDVITPTFGVGVDYGIKPRITIRLEWQRYMDLEYNSSKFDIDTTRIGFMGYF